jgi:anti-sigma B factor antagonist
MILEVQKKAAENGMVVLEMAGRITLGPECQMVESSVDELVRNKQTRIIFDLGKVKYMDSSGVGILVMCSEKIKEAGGQLRLAGAKGVVEQTLTLTRMNLIVPTYATVDEAVAGFAGQGSGARLRASGG